MKNQKLIDEIEKIKGVLTQAQKDLEEGNLQGAGDCTVGCTLMLKAVARDISDQFNSR